MTWNWRDGGVEQILDVPALDGYPSPAGDRVATPKAPTATGRRDTVEMWDPATGRRVAALEGNTGSVQDIAFSPDGSRLATGGVDGTVTIWDAASGEQLLVLRGHYTWSPRLRSVPTARSSPRSEPRASYASGRSTWTISSRSPSVK